MARATEIETSKRALDHVVDAASAALQSLPWTGGLAKYLEELYPTLQTRQIRAICEQLTRDGRGIESVRADLDALAALTTRVLHESMQTPSEAKRAALRNIVLNYAAGMAATASAVESYVAMVAAMSDLQVQMLALGGEIVARTGRFASDSEMDRPLTDFFTGYPDGLVNSECWALMNKGLLPIPYVAPFVRGDTKVRVGRLSLTPLGLTLLDWIKR